MLFRSDDAKANQNLITIKPRWFEKQTFTLNNGPDGTAGDNVGVLVPWEPPVETLNNREKLTVLNALEVGVLDDEGRPTGDPYTFNRSGRKNDRWAGVLFEDIRPKWSVGEVKAELTHWIADGFIAEVESPTSKSKGVMRKGLKVRKKPDPEPEPVEKDYADELV